MDTAAERARSFEYPELGTEPFNIDPDEMMEVWKQDKPPDGEKEMRQCFERIAGQSFELVSEVYLRHPNADRLRIDYVGREKTGAIQGLIGFELKSAAVATEAFGGWCDAVAQAVDYSKSRIESDFAGDKKDWFGRSLKWVFMFPCPYQIYEQANHSGATATRDLWAQGGAQGCRQVRGRGCGIRKEAPRLGSFSWWASRLLDENWT